MAIGRLGSFKTSTTVGLNTNTVLYTSTGTLSNVTINVTNQGTEDAVFSIGISSGTAFRDSDVIIYGQTIEKNTYASITNVGICSGETIFVRANKANISFIVNSVVDYDASIGTFFGRQDSVRTSLSGPVFVNTPVVLYTAPKAAQVSISVNNTSPHNSRYSIGISSGGLLEFTSADYIIFGQSLPKRTTQIIDSIGIGTGQSIIVRANESGITFAAYDLPTSVLEKIIVTDAISIGSSVTAFGGFYGNLVGIATYATSAGIATNVSGGIASVTSLSVSGISTLDITSATNLTAQQLNVSGVGTIATFNNTTANITTGNIVTGVVTTISGTNLNYTGVSTLGITSATNLTSQTLNVSGLSTFAGVTTHTASLFGTTASFIGVVTATTGNFTNVSISNAITTVAGKPILNSTGSILQVVQGTLTNYFGTTSTIPLDDTIPQNTEGDEFLTASITPLSTTSKILVLAVVHVANDSSAYINGICLFRNSVSNALAASWSRTVVNNNPVSAMVLEYLDSPSSVSALTYKLRGGTVGGTGGQTFQVNGGSGTRYLGGALVTTLTLMEVSA